MDKLKNRSLFLLDMDGTLYLGGEVFPGAVEFVTLLKERGVPHVFLTNNSSRAAVDYVNRMRALSFPCETENVFTSGMAAGLTLKRERPAARVFVLGTEALRREIEGYGLRVTDSPSADVVLAGFDTELSYKKLDTACRALRAGADFYACNPDLVCPMPGGVMLPDCGSICALLTAATGRVPTYLGKPSRAMVDIPASVFGKSVSDAVCVGDRLYTDIALAKNAGAVSVLLLSGETTAGMLASSEIRPDYVFENVAALAGALMAK